MNEAVIGVGSNISPWENIQKARQRLSRDHTLVKESPFVTTAPIGHKQQTDFINGAFLVKTTLCRNPFRQYLKTVEDDLGRVRTGNKYGPRTMDLDIVVWNGKIVDDDYFTRDFLRDSVNAVMPELRETTKHYGKG